MLSDRSSIMKRLRKRVATVPQDPGVYRWLDTDGVVMYVGKAKNLRNRMKSYVQEGAKRSAWMEIMVRQIADFDVTVVRSEVEALILEANLIKELKPKYNIMLKDDKGYAFVRISLHESYPQVEVVRRTAGDGAKYFGPFLGSRDIRETLDMLDRILHFRACAKSVHTLNSRKDDKENSSASTLPPTSVPCLDYQIGKCCGVCIGAVTQQEYRERIHEVERFFRGNFSSIQRRADEEMRAAAAQKQFEKAARIRDVLRFIQELETKQVVSDTSGDDADIFGIALRQGKIQVVLFRQRDGKLIEQVGFPLKGEAESITDVLAQFLPQYYGDTQDIPETVVVGASIPEQNVLETWLRERRGKAVKIIVPERGKKSALLDMAERNAQEKVNQQFAAWEAESQKVEGALKELATLLKLPEPPRRIEGYDISHLGGTATVASMVVFVHGKPKRDHYRSFNMKTVKEGDIDDYKSIAEALRRRLKYVTEDLKAMLSQLKAEGIDIGKARKPEQKIIEEISKKHHRDRESDDISFQDYLVARKADEIVGFCRLFPYPGNVLTLRSVWVKETENVSRLGQTLVRAMLSRVKKGKVYVHVREEALLERYAEVGFQVVATPPDVLQKKMSAWHAEHPGDSPGTVLVYIASKQKTDPSFSERPDLLLIDGGKGQLSAAVAVLKEMGAAIPIAGLAKREEEIFLPGRTVSLPVPTDSQARFLLQRLRDEAHRFANAKREKRLENALFHSKLDDIPGIGTETKTTLLRRFGSADAAILASDGALRETLSTSQLASLRKQFPQKNS